LNGRWEETLAKKNVKAHTSNDNFHYTIVTDGGKHVISRYRDGRTIGKTSSLEDALALIKVDVGKPIVKMEVNDV
jgi:hypothetical protein